MAAPDRPPDWLPDPGPETAPPATPLKLIDVLPRPAAGHRLWVEVDATTR